LLGVGTRTPTDEPESSNQLVPYKQAEEREKPELEMTVESVILPASEGTGAEPPTVEEIHEDALARYLDKHSIRHSSFPG
jgi:3-polyprenyl-4-hydroxybenzoate decarboxylase